MLDDKAKTLYYLREKSVKYEPSSNPENHFPELNEKWIKLEDAKEYWSFNPHVVEIQQKLEAVRKHIETFPLVVKGDASDMINACYNWYKKLVKILGETKK